MFEFLLAATIHFSPTDYNQIHPHVRYETSNLHIITGAYYNSESRLSVYVGKKSYWTDNVWTEAGLVTGYSKYKIVPMSRAGYQVNDMVNLFVAPMWDDYGLSGVVGIEVLLGWH